MNLETPKQQQQQMQQQQQSLQQQQLQDESELERAYVAKVKLMQNYIQPVATMLRQVERLLENYAGDKSKRENLEAINKKMMCIYKLLHQQTSRPPNLQQYLKVLDASERQIKHWLQQLQINDAKLAQPQQL